MHWSTTRPPPRKLFVAMNFSMSSNIDVASIKSMVLSNSLEELAVFAAALSDLIDTETKANIEVVSCNEFLHEQQP